MNETTDKVSAATINVASNEEVTPTEAVEEWRTIVGYEGLYEVSSLGRVRNCTTDKILKPILKSSGHVAVNLYKPSETGNRRMRQFRINRLVAEIFVPRRRGKDQVDHIDGNKLNNAAVNLRWVDAKENHNNPVTLAKKRSPEMHIIYQNSSKTRRSVYCIELEISYPSGKEAATILGVNQASISSMCRQEPNLHSLGLFSRKLNRRLHFRFV